MAPTAAAKEAKGPTTTITGSFFCRVQKSQKSACEIKSTPTLQSDYMLRPLRDLTAQSRAKSPGASRNTSTRGRKLLTPEEPDVLRPHCEKCGYGEALRAGLDCRCHCPQCSSGKPRCSSPRMALRRAEGETCATFTTKLALTRSRVAARDSQTKASASNQSNRCSSAINLAAKSEGKKPNRTGDAVPDEECQKPANVRDVPSELKKSTTTKTNSPCQTESRKPLAKRELSTESLSGKSGETALQSTGKQSSSRAPCKRQKQRGLKPDAPSLCLGADNTSTKYRRPHCPMCSQLGCLRNIEVVCYCDACQESKGEQCSSPRMADFRKSHPGYESKSGKKASQN